MVVVVVVVGVSVVVVMVGARVVVDGDSVTVCVVPPGAEAAERRSHVRSLAAAYPEVDDVVDVPAGLLPLLPVNFTTAYTSNARTTAVSTPRPTSAAGFRDHGVGSGRGGCPYPVGGPYRAAGSSLYASPPVPP